MTWPKPIVLLLALASASFAQRPARPTADVPPPLSPAEACSISGQVVKSGTGEPIKKARVTLVREGGRQQPILVLTNAEGKFSITDIPGGRYRLSVARNGFVRADYGQSRPGRPGAPLTVAPGQNVPDLVFRLLPAGVVTGRIFDEDGDPLPGVFVSLLRQRYVRGQKQWVPAESAPTNDLGDYRIAGLAPGKVFLAVSAPQVANFPGSGVQSLPGRDSSENNPDSYAPTYYPGTTDIAQARAIDVAPGEEIRSIDLTLTPVRTVRVRGRVVNPAGGDFRQPASVMLTPRSFLGRGGFQRNAAASEDSQGQFELRGVPPGSYVLMAMWNDGRTPYAAREAIDVGNSNLEGVTLSLSPAIEVSGHVKLEGAPETRFSRLNVAFVPREDSLSADGSGASVSPTGTFVIRNLVPDAYRVAVTGALEDAYLKSARVGGEEVSENGFQLGRVSAATLEIVLSPNGASVSGFVRDANQLPCAGATVVLVPDGDNRRNSTLFRTAIADQLGQFSIRGVRPGKYKLFSWDDVENGAWLDPAFLAPAERRGEAIVLEESSRKTVELKLISQNP